MFIYDMARKVNAHLKMKKKATAGKIPDTVRRIEKTSPLSTGLFVAMTFDDGPNAALPNPVNPLKADRKGLTEELLEVLDKYGAKGTFNVIGTTKHNYPDKKGKTGDFSWSGVKYDHYPAFGEDMLAGVENQAQLAKEIAAGGHELSNHGYKHVLFGPMRIIYGRRRHFGNLTEVIRDLDSLHQLVYEETGQEMKMSRPPHYIDKVPDGSTSYDAYRYMGYQYLAASFDGGGWKPSSGNYNMDVKAMVDSIESALTQKPDILNGQIIFQKDGCNMSGFTPVADALDKCLKLLYDAGYKVVTASRLLDMSPFEDVDDTDPAFKYIRSLTAKGLTAGYRNNTFQPDRLVTRRELAVFSTPSALLVESYRRKIDNAGYFVYDIYKAASECIKDNPLLSGYSASPGWWESEEPVTAIEFDRILSAAGKDADLDWHPDEFKEAGIPAQQAGLLRRRDIVKALDMFYS